MQHRLVWKPWLNPGVENLRLSIDEQGITATSHLMQNLQGSSIAANYVLNYATDWQFCSLWLKVHNHGQRSLKMARDEQGNWLLNGQIRPDLSECQQIMLSDSPFTHTPLLRRCVLANGESQTIKVAHIDLLTLTVTPLFQRYQRLSDLDGQTHYCSEIQGMHCRQLSVDQNALLINAFGQFRRISARRLQH